MRHIYRDTCGAPAGTALLMFTAASGFIGYIPDPTRHPRRYAWRGWELNDDLSLGQRHIGAGGIGTVQSDGTFTDIGVNRQTGMWERA